MALPGTGFRSALSVMLEMSGHLVQDFVYTSLTSAVTAVGTATVSVSSLGINRNAVYVGAQLVIDQSTVNQEIITVTAVNEFTSSFTAMFTLMHAVGASVIGATFPVQASSGDFFYSQSEILSYIARAQNQFLADVPCILALNTQFVQFGQIYQQLVCNAIEINRIASSALTIPITSLTRASNLVTAVSASPHGLIAGSKFSIYNTPDPSFVGAFKVGNVVSPTSWTYTQYQPDSSAPDGTAVLWLRLLETSQEELSIQNPFWRNQNITRLRAFFEDRTGVYKWGVDGKPATTIPVEILVSERDTDTLEMTDFFLVPDVLLHGVKYKALSYCWSKDGEGRDPLRQKYCEMRYDRLVMAAHRWLDGLGIEVGEAEKAMR